MDYNYFKFFYIYGNYAIIENTKREYGKDTRCESNCFFYCSPA